jgi:hypothetical protein
VTDVSHWLRHILAVCCIRAFAALTEPGFRPAPGAYLRASTPPLFENLRHCFGSWLAMNRYQGEDGTDASQMAAMTLRYLHLSVDHKRQAIMDLAIVHR